MSSPSIKCIKKFTLNCHWWSFSRIITNSMTREIIHCRFERPLIKSRKVIPNYHYLNTSNRTRGGAILSAMQHFLVCSCFMAVILRPNTREGAMKVLCRKRKAAPLQCGLVYISKFLPSCTYTAHSGVGNEYKHVAASPLITLSMPCPIQSLI